MNMLRELLADCVHAALGDGRCTVREVADQAQALYADVIAAEGERLAGRQVRQMVKELFRQISGGDDDGSQKELPGLSLPAAIAVREDEARSGDDAIYYIRSDKATWAQVMAGLEERRRNQSRVAFRVARYEEAVERLRLWMERDPSCTVAEALQREAKARALVGESAPVT